MIFRNCYTKFHEPLGEWNLRQFWNVTSGIYAKNHVPVMLLFVYTATRKSFVIFTCRYFKLSWNTTALSQSNCRNLSCSSINGKIRIPECGKFLLVESGIQLKEFRIQRITVKEFGIQYVESRIHNAESRILDVFT